MELNIGDLSAIEQRALGCLAEKQLCTPEYYPLTLNSLVLACNQKTNRDPVTDLTEEQAAQALQALRDRGLAVKVSEAGGRVPKHRHNLPETLKLNRGELALLCVLLLRGPQTLGELRGRTERMHEFDSLQQVQDMLERLENRDPPLALCLPREMGRKEPRYIHKLGPVEYSPLVPAAEIRADSSAEAMRIAALEQKVDTLETQLRELREQFDSFRRQLE